MMPDAFVLSGKRMQIQKQANVRPKLMHGPNHSPIPTWDMSAKIAKRENGFGNDFSFLAVDMSMFLMRKSVFMQ